MNVGELRKEIENVPDKAEVILLSDSGSLDSVFATYDDHGKSGMFILDGAYRRGNPIAITPNLLSFSKTVNKSEVF